MTVLQPRKPRKQGARMNHPTSMFSLFGAYCMYRPLVFQAFCLGGLLCARNQWIGRGIGFYALRVQVPKYECTVPPATVRVGFGAQYLHICVN